RSSLPPLSPRLGRCRPLVPWSGSNALAGHPCLPQRKGQAFSTCPLFQFAAISLLRELAILSDVREPDITADGRTRPAVLKSSLPARIPVRPGSPGRRSTPPPST